MMDGRRGELARVIGKSAKKHREKVSLSQEKLAQRMDASRETIRAIEAGKHLPNLALIERLCQALDLSLADLLAEDRATATRPERQAGMWQQAIQDWSAYLSVTGHSDKTIREYRRTLLNFMADTLLDPFEVTQDQIVSHVAALPRNGSMRGMVLRALRSFYGWAEERGHGNPATRLKVPGRKYGPAPFLDASSRSAHVKALEAREPRRAWTYNLIYSTGGRIGSVCAARPEDVRGDRIYFRVAKNDDPYSVPLGPLAREAVTNLMAWTPPTRRHRSNGTLVGVGEERVRQWFEQAEADTGIPLWPHLLRHSFLTEMADLADQRTWMQLANHKDLSQFRRYVAYRDERGVAAVEALR